MRDPSYYWSLVALIKPTRRASSTLQHQFTDDLDDLETALESDPSRFWAALRFPDIIEVDLLHGVVRYPVS